MDAARLIEAIETAFLHIEQRLTKQFRRRSRGGFPGPPFRNCYPCRRGGDSKLVQDVKPPSGSKRQNTRRNFVRIVPTNFRSALNAKSLFAARKQQPQIIVNFRGRRDVRTR